MRYLASVLIICCGLIALSCAVSQLMAQTATPQASIPHNPLLPPLPDPMSTPVRPPLNTVPLNLYRQTDSAAQSLTAAIEAQLREYERQLATARRKLADLESKLHAGNLTAQQRSALALQVDRQRKTVAELQAGLASKRTSLAQVRALLAKPLILRQQGQPPVLSEPTLPTSHIRNLLFTPEDAAQVMLFHPLLTPDIQIRVRPLQFRPSQYSAQAHTR